MSPRVINHSSGHSDHLPGMFASAAGFAERSNTIDHVMEEHGLGMHEITHYHLSYYFEMAVECINSVAGLIVLLAVLLAGVNLLIVIFNAALGTKQRMLDPFHMNSKHFDQHCIKSAVLRIRLIMGEQISLALGLLVASDILDTVIKPSHAYELLDVVKMGFVTVLRTGLAYFLSHEIKDLEEDHRNKNKNKQQQQQAQQQAQGREDHAGPPPPLSPSVSSSMSKGEGERSYRRDSRKPPPPPPAADGQYDPYYYYDSYPAHRRQRPPPQGCRQGEREGEEVEGEEVEEVHYYSHSEGQEQQEGSGGMRRRAPTAA